MSSAVIATSVRTGAESRRGLRPVDRRVRFRHGFSLVRADDERRRMRVKRIMAMVTVALAIAVTADAAAKGGKQAKRGVPDTVLAAAAKAAMLSEINYDRPLCDEDRSVETWLKDVVGDSAVSIEWRGGACELTNDLNPLDAGSDWCGGATVIPKGHAKEPAVIEVYFEKPVHGKPGRAYAFRAVNYDVDGLDYKRDWPSFEYGYRQKYEKDFVAPEVGDCD